jgi:membrane protein implicated in regulation of membrane protease activity
VFRGAIVSIEGGCRIEGRISKFRFRTVGAYLCFGLAALFVGHRTPTVTFSIVAVAVAVLGTASITLFQRVSYLERKKILSELGRL